MKEKIKTEKFEHSVRVAVVGFVRGQAMLEICSNFENVEAVGICDIDPEKRNMAGQLFPNTPFFDNFDEMLEKIDMDALIVETPADYHAEICSKALARNIHVLSDIPCVDSVEEGNKLFRSVQEADAIYMSGANPNFRPSTQALLDIHSRGWLGKPYYIEAEYIHDLSSFYNKTPWRVTYPPIKYCTHSLGPVLELIGENFEWVSCFGTGSHTHSIPGQHDAMSALLRTKSNIVVRLLVSFVNKYDESSHFIRVFGTEGSAVFHPAGREMFKIYSVNNDFNKFQKKNSPAGAVSDHLCFHPAQALQQYEGYPNWKSHGGADYELIMQFISSIRTEAPSPVPIEKALAMCLPGIYANQSAENDGLLTKIEYPWT